MKNITYLNAGAGSGKTHSLTQILADLIKDRKVKPEQVILTTFTVKAANEFKEKAKAFLFDYGMYDEALRLDHAMIGTVHSVCQRMIGKYWFNLGLAPDMGVMAEEDIAFYRSQSLAELPTEDELNLLHDYAELFDIRIIEDYMPKGINYDFWQQQLNDIIDYATNYELEDFEESKSKSLEFLEKFVNKSADCNFTYEFLNDVVKEHETFLRNQKASAANDTRIEKVVQAKLGLAHPTFGLLKSLDSTIGSPKGFGSKAQEFHDRMALLWESQTVFEKQKEYIELLFSLALRWKDRYAQFKREKNLLDYNDMEKYMRQLMQKEEVKQDISKDFKYLFVDEFQDSSPMQVKIFDALSDLMTHSYWVGDYKQAIYGFRGADINLTKAVVDEVSKGIEGCDTRTLGASYRSLPDIVDVNNAVFEQTFSGVLAKGNIILDKTRENKNGETSLRYIRTDKEVGIAEHIVKLIKTEGAELSDIAVLSRTKEPLKVLATKLNDLNVPYSIKEGLPVTDSLSFSLLASLLQVMDNSCDALAKATVAILTENDWNTKRIIEEKLVRDAEEQPNREEFLAEVPLIRQLLAIRPRLQQQSIASLVESLVVELNLYDVVKTVEGNSQFGISCLQTIISAARAYEDHCVQMNLPASIAGFIAYLEERKPVFTGDPKGVQLFTYHGSKGLQWKYVILSSLESDKAANEKDIIKKDVFGVQVVHGDKIDGEIYQNVYIRIVPWIYGSANNTNVPANINAIITGTGDFAEARDSRNAEENRLFYVGMTRPRDVLIVVADTTKKNVMKLPRDVGMASTSAAIPSQGDWDVFGTGHKFADFTITPVEIEDITPLEVDEEAHLALNVPEPTFEKREARYLSPSRIHAKGEVLSTKDFGERIPFGHQPGDMAEVGNCIHQIFACIGDVGADDHNIARIISNNGMKAVLSHPESVAKAWKNLYGFLKTSNENFIAYHERPFRLERDGQTIVGSIDLVWQTEEGDILVDFKTCPMGPEAVLNPNSVHYVGLYAGQLDAYEDALTAAGEKVLKRFIYYPVNGLLVEVGRGQ